MALTPEETMSKKKNRHEVTDLIKGEKYTSSRETSISDAASAAREEGDAGRRLRTLEGTSVT